MADRSRLRRVALSKVWPPRVGKGRLYLTMSVGQWDATLQAGYDVGAVLLELDDDERPVAAYQRPEPECN